ncbi:hypothetical protein ACFOG5_19140 [Pedobacter fastidiosus]|uniref:Uncharacterized protein n=1 Tax=Pedobacter fastidiosus TaxID=2765361 RepID=A0ABR7KY15_9SPHI|nr:hypothetical protein [Pedobacter fastidiosus]MBC6113014.1 hypothetical protein [Pedobacter fastidiosus]
MKRTITALFLYCYFLAGSVIFPLSDFSLMRDLPAMYRSYCEIRVGKPDICDFVGDYLLHGKELFGNNAHDAKPKNGGTLQFQHQPTLSIFFVQHVFRLFTDIGRLLTNEPVYHDCDYSSEYYHQHFRPPIA